MLAVEIINEHYLANINNRDSEPGHYTDSPLCIVLSFLSGSRIMCYDQRRFANDTARDSGAGFGNTRLRLLSTNESDRSVRR